MGFIPGSSPGSVRLTCPHCGKEQLRGQAASSHRYECRHCGKQFTKAEAEAKRDYNLEHNGDSWVHMSVWDRCITRGVPGGMFPAGYNNAYQILQVPGAVVILYEMIHEARIIPVDGRPHVLTSPLERERLVQLWLALYGERYREAA